MVEASKALRTVLLSTMVLFQPAMAAAEEYKVQEGDTIEISIGGIPDLRQRTAVQPDGAIVLPLAGTVPVAGLAAAELRDALQTRFARKIYRRIAADGRDVSTVIQPEDVAVNIVEYRPIYVTGDVAKPGEEVFRPGMTVRQALALAGGAQVPAALFANAPANLAALRSDYWLALTELARATAKGASVDAELNGDNDLPPVDFGGMPLPRATLDELSKSEGAMLKARAAGDTRERDYLRDSIVRADDRIAVLQRQQAEEEEGSRADSAELQRLIELLSKGRETNPRVTEARRALLLSSTRALQVNAELLELKRQKAESVRAVQRFEDERRIRLLKELDEATVAKATSRIRLDALQAELGLARNPSEMTDPFGGVQLKIELIRRNQGASIRLPADIDSLLMPGDVISVTLRLPDTSANNPR